MPWWMIVSCIKTVLPYIVPRAFEGQRGLGQKHEQLPVIESSGRQAFQRHGGGRAAKPPFSFVVLWCFMDCASMSHFSKPSFTAFLCSGEQSKVRSLQGRQEWKLKTCMHPALFVFFFRPQIIHGWDAAHIFHHELWRPKSFCSPFGRGFRCCTSSFCFAGEYTSLDVSVDEALTVHWLARLVASKRWNGKQSCIFKKICKHTTSSLFVICSTGMSQAHVWTHIATYKLKSLEVKYQYYSTTVCHRHR